LLKPASTSGAQVSETALHAANPASPAAATLPGVDAGSGSGPASASTSTSAHATAVAAARGPTKKPPL